MFTEKMRISVIGHVLIRNKVTGEILLDKNNSIHPENFSEAIAMALSNKGSGTIQYMTFGNGASTVNGIGAVTYFPTNTVGQDARLHNATYRKIVDDNSPLNTDVTSNYITISHVKNQPYTDIIVTCLLDFNEPSGQMAFDDATDNNDSFIFDELGLGMVDSAGNNRLLTHVVFHPIQKAMNTSIEVTYTVRILMV